MKYLITLLTPQGTKQHTINAHSFDEAKLLTIKHFHIAPHSICIAPPQFPTPIPQQHIMLFFHQLFLMLQANLPLKDAIYTSITNCQNQRLAHTLNLIYNHLNNGLSLGESFEPFANIFGTLTTNLICIGAQSNRLVETLEMIVLYQQEQLHYRKNIKKAFRYPLFLILTIFFAFAILLELLIPQFIDIFSTNSIPVPLYTQILFDLHRTISQNFLWIIGGGVCVGSCVYLSFLRKGRSANFIYKILWHIPLIGGIMKQNTCYLFFLSLSLFYQAKIPINLALHNAIKLIPYPFVSHTLFQALQSLEDGNSLSHALQECKFFDPLLLSLVATSQNSGNLGEILELCAKEYKNQLQDNIQQNIAYLEPMLTIVLGGFVLFLALAILTPLQDLNQLISF
ncbi:hypothetical protein BBW65_05460 [Helicobacter enhydrae]|uniref:Type II secretion system protein GspF domain-containing protein n=1 Tax=Helicobacter enhydrae TaxID=222136 RepID=A0A1B1U695_9HELI|nr:type II secretion system F family protein [Helicobacter enhydrae]ANV98278.1 hypothetical protein BBW65_05460 [Helicobacter enhydrae]